MRCDPVAEYRGPILDVIQVEPAKHRAVRGDEYVVAASASVLLGQHGIVPFGELIEVLIAAIVDEGGEVVAVGYLKGQERRGMVGPQALQLWHRHDHTQRRSVSGRPPPLRRSSR